MEEEMVDGRFRQGQEIEVGSNEVGFKGSWYAATVLHCSNTPSRSASKITKMVFVQYQTLMKDELGSNPLSEYVSISVVRPRRPPPDEEEENRSFEVDEAVEVFYNDGWWEGSIMQVLENQKYRVFFRDSNEELVFHQSEIRRQLNWINGRWVKAQKVEEVPVTPQAQSQIRSARLAQSWQGRRKSSKVENQLTHTKASSVHYSRISRKKNKMQSSLNSDAGILQPCKKLKTAEGMKTPLSLMDCPVRGMSSDASIEVDGRHGVTTLTVKGKRTSFARKRKSFCALTAIFMDFSSEKYSEDHPSPLGSCHKKPNHSLESNGFRDHPLVEGCRSQHPLETFEVEQHNLVVCPKTKVLIQRKLKLKVRLQRRESEPLGVNDVRLQKMEGCNNQTRDVCNKRRQTTTKDSSTITAVTGGKQQAARGSQAPAAQTETQTIGHEQSTPSKETTLAGHIEDASKETEKDGASNDNLDLHQPLSMLFRDSCLKGRVQELKRLKVQAQRRERMDGDNMKLQIMEVKSNQAIDVFDQRKQATSKDSSTKTAVKGGKSSIVVEGSSSLGHITVDTESDMAVRNEHNDIHLSWPFVKCSPLWKMIDSWEVFRTMPQKLHFHPLQQYDMDLREGHAIGCMVNFASLVENIRKSQIEDPLSQVQDWSKALDDLEVHGFNVQPIRARLKEVTRLKDNYKHFVSKTKLAEEKMKMLKDENEQLAARLVEADKGIRERVEIINQLKKQLESFRLENELRDSEISKLMTRRNEIREGIDSLEPRFNITAAAPW